MINCRFCGRVLALGDDPESPGFTFEPVIAQPVADGVVVSCDRGCAARELCTKDAQGRLRPVVQTVAGKRLADFAMPAAVEALADARARIKVARPDVAPSFVDEKVL